MGRGLPSELRNAVVQEQEAIQRPVLRVQRPRSIERRLSPLAELRELAVRQVPKCNSRSDGSPFERVTGCTWPSPVRCPTEGTGGGKILKSWRSDCHPLSVPGIQVSRSSSPLPTPRASVDGPSRTSSSRSRLRNKNCYSLFQEFADLSAESAAVPGMWQTSSKPRIDRSTRGQWLQSIQSQRNTTTE